MVPASFGSSGCHDSHILPPPCPSDLACGAHPRGGPALAQQGREPARPSGAQGKPASGPARPGPSQPSTRATQPAPAAKPQAARPQPARPQAAAPAGAPGGGAATLVATFGDWGVYTAQTGRAKICYALTQPKERLPKALSRDPAYLFVSFRPAENVRNEVALVMGFPTRESGPAQASIGQATYALLTKEQNAWLKNPAEEGQAIATMAQRPERHREGPVPARQPADRPLLPRRLRPGPRARPQGMLLIGRRFSAHSRLRDSRFRRKAPICGPRPDNEGMISHGDGARHRQAEPQCGSARAPRGRRRGRDREGPRADRGRRGALPRRAHAATS